MSTKYILYGYLLKCHISHYFLSRVLTAHRTSRHSQQKPGAAGRAEAEFESSEIQNTHIIEIAVPSVYFVCIF